MSETNEPRVLLLEPLRGDSDIDSLREFGPVLTLFNAVCSDLPSVFDTGEFIGMLRIRLKEHNYDPKQDYFAVSGRLSKIAIALSAICVVNLAQGFDTKVLLYDGGEQRFKERVL